MSSYTDEISELAGEAFIAIGKKIAENLSVKNGDGLVITTSDTEISLEVKILNRIASGCVGYSVGYFETRNFSAGNLVSLAKDNNWQRRIPQIIATDRASKIPPTSSEETLHA
jgi:predicted molibdopterin-dependent oxidoreductase YjgC